MSVETATYIGSLDQTLPLAGDPVSQGADHLRLLKKTLQKTFPGMAGELFRVIPKAASFYLSASETGAVLVCTVSMNVFVPALSGIPVGTFWLVQARANTVTLSINTAGENFNGGATSYTGTSGNWWLIIREATGWCVLRGEVLTGTDIVTRIGTVAVQYATTALDALKLQGNAASAFALNTHAHLTAAYDTVGAYTLATSAYSDIGAETAVAGSSLLAVRFYTTANFPAAVMVDKGATALTGTWRNVENFIVTSRTVGLFFKVA